jgi:hypothetical protein
MDILNNYAAVIIGSVDGLSTLKQLKHEGCLNWSAFLTLSDYNSSEKQIQMLLEMLNLQDNREAVARLFEIIQDSYPQLCSMMPELSNGERYSLYLGYDKFLKVMVNNGDITVDVTKIQVSVSSFIFFTPNIKHGNV